VEDFVESYYQHQISRLRHDAAHEAHGPSVELRRMLEHCCEDEVHHKEEAIQRAAEGPLPWLAAVDGGWQWLVGTSSALAAKAAKAM
jgi:demethoxyubiquinone hydroxylase (CLK1/Coq7/Cat5 family)